MLEHGGFKVLTADGGRTALNMYREHCEQIDAVLLDLTMPDLNGDEVYRKLIEIRSGVPVVVVSGYSEEHVAERFAGIGPAVFLGKPYKTANLIAKVGAAIAAYRADAG
jgi:CheY-like chemotaxis protein